MSTDTPERPLKTVPTRRLWSELYSDWGEDSALVRRELRERGFTRGQQFACDVFLFWLPALTSVELSNRSLVTGWAIYSGVFVGLGGQLGGLSFGLGAAVLPVAAFVTWVWFRQTEKHEHVARSA